MNKTASNRLDGTLVWKQKLVRFSKDYMIVIALLIAVVIFSLASKYFLTANNLLTILLQSTTVAIVAIGQAYVVLGGNLDLSLGQNVCLSCFVSAILIKSYGVNPWIGLLAGFLCATLIGLINGIMVAYIQIPTFIATLGMMNICTGVAKIISHAATFSGMPKEISFLGRGYLFGVIPVSVVIMLGLYIVMGLVASKSVLGRYIYSIGASREAAFYSGIKVKLYTLLTFVIAGAAAGISSIVLLSRLDAATTSSGDAYEFAAVIGCVLGGISMSGGKGKLSQALLGVVFLMVFFNGMTQLNVNAFYQEVIKGFVLILAIAIDVMRNRVKN